jgi:hypothetical protein
MSQRRTPPLLIAAIALAVITPLAFAAWMVRGAKREAEEDARARPPAVTSVPGARTTPLRLGGPSRPTTGPLVPKVTVPPAPVGDGEGQMAAIDRAARERAAAQAGLTPEESRRVEQIHLESDRRREDIEKRSDWASDEDLSALHDNAAAEQKALQAQLGDRRAQLLHTAEQDSYRRILRDSSASRSPVNRRLQMLRLSDSASKAVGAAPAGQAVEEEDP